MTEYCKLVAHYGSDKYTAPELMKEALVCVFLTRCLQATGYFGIQEKIEPVFGVEELQIALWMHRFMRIARFNCHAIREVKKPFVKVHKINAWSFCKFKIILDWSKPVLDKFKYFWT